MSDDKLNERVKKMKDVARWMKSQLVYHFEMNSQPFAVGTNKLACMMCYEAVERHSNWMKFACGHVGHYECLEKQMDHKMFVNCTICGVCYSMYDPNNHKHYEECENCCILNDLIECYTK